MRYPASSGAVLGSSVVRQCGVLGARCDTRQDRRACRLFLGTRDRGRVPRKQVGIGRFPLGSEGGQKRGRLWRLLFSLSFLLSLSLLFSHPLLFSSSFLFSFFLPGPPGPGRAREGPRRREEGTGPCRRRQFSEDGGVFGGDEVFGGLGGFPRTGGVFGGRGGFRRKGRFSEEGEVFGGGGGFSEEGERGGGGSGGPLLRSFGRPRRAKSTKWLTVGSGHSKCVLGVVFWQHQEHEVAYSSLRTFKMWPGSCVLGTRRARSGLQLAPGIQNVAREWSSGNSKNTKWPTVGSGHSKCGPGMEFWELEDHEVRYCLLKMSSAGFPPDAAQTPLRSHDALVRHY